MNYDAQSFIQMINRMNTITSNFYKDGYHIEKNIFPKKNIGVIENEFDYIVKQLKLSGENINARWDSKLRSALEQNKMDTEVIHTHNVQSYSAEMLFLLQDKKFLDVVESLIGQNIILHHTKLFLKPPKKGAAFPLHQDWSYFPTINNSMIAAVLHLSESTEKMGCLRIVPGSNKLGQIEDTDGHSFIPKIHNKYKLEDACPIIADPGDIVFFHSCSLHGSMPNFSNKPRKTILFQFYSGNDRVIDNNQHTNVQLVLRGRNQYASRNSVGNL